MRHASRDILAAAASSAGAALPQFWLEAMITSATITERSPPPRTLPRIICSLGAFGNSTETVRIADRITRTAEPVAAEYRVEMAVRQVKPAHVFVPATLLRAHLSLRTPSIRRGLFRRRISQ